MCGFHFLIGVELRETGIITLRGADNGAIGARSRLSFDLEESDAPYGRLAFSPDSVAVVAAELDISVAKFTVLRHKGTTGIVIAEWTISQKAFDDIETTSQIVTFLDGVNSQSFTILIRQDTVIGMTCLPNHAQLNHF